MLPDVPGASLAAAFHPAGEGLEVGGDFYDVFSTGDGQWYLVMGDVAGKGAEAAAVTALARYTLRTAAARRRSPAAILRWVGQAMLDQDATGGRYCTIACAHVDLARSPARVTVSCGGHPLPALRRADGSVEALGTTRARCSDCVPDPELQDRSTELRPGDTIVLYTDGLTEARAPVSMWSFEELAAAIRAAPSNGPVGLVDSLVTSALGERTAPRDDLAVLALKLDRALLVVGLGVAGRPAVVVVGALVRFPPFALRRALGRRIIDRRRLLFRISDIGFSGLHSRYLPTTGDAASRVLVVPQRCSSASSSHPPTMHPRRHVPRSRCSTRSSRPRCWRTCSSSSPSSSPTR